MRKAAVAEARRAALTERSTAPTAKARYPEKVPISLVALLTHSPPLHP